jgi:tricorn protease-like protein
VRDFLRGNRYASSIITTVVLVLVGFLVAVTRNDGPKQPVVLRADEQALRPQSTILTPTTATPQPLRTIPIGPGPTLGKIATPARPVPGGAGGGGTTVTTGASGGPTTTTAAKASPFSANRIAYSAGGSMWTVNPDGLDPRSLAVSGYFPAWSSDHGAIAFADGDPGGALSVLNADGTRFGLTTGVVKDGQPAWSPDGTKLAFARIDNTASQGYSSIWVIGRDGSNLHKIATSGCLNRDPAWSPDGTKIAFWSSRDHCDEEAADAGDYELYVLNLLNSETTRLATATNSGTPAWSPDGRTIAFGSDGYGGVGMEIVLVGADGKNPRRITNTSGDDLYPAWSPDGSRIAFRSDRNDGGVFTMKTDGSDVQLVVAGGYQPAWR